MNRSMRAASALTFVAMAVAGCGRVDTLDSADVGLPVETTPTSKFVEENAALRRITMEEFTDVSVEIDYSTIGGFDLKEVAPAADISFCEAAGSARIAWIDGSAIELQLWHDTYIAADDIPAPVQFDAAVLLEHVAQRIAWNFRRADRPVADERIVTAAHRVVTAAVDDCSDLPLVIGSDDERLRAPWTEGSYSDLDPAAACAEDFAEVTAAIDRYRELRGIEPRHLEQVEAALLRDESVFFFGSDLHVIAGESAGIALIEPIGLGPCGE